MKLSRKTPCKECPFRKTSAPRWLGPWTMPEIMRQAHSEAGLGCHLSAAEEKSDPETTHVCVGSLQNANLSGKSYRNPILREWADIVGNGKGQILKLFEFIKHHGDEDGS